MDKSQKNWVRMHFFAYGFLLLVIAFLLPFHDSWIPAEDASMLFAYSENWVDTGIISYYSCGPRAEGATDFLWMAILAFGYLLTIPPFIFSWILSLLSILFIHRLWWDLLDHQYRSPLASLVIFISLLSAMQFWAALQGFSVYFFGLTLSWAAYSLIKEKPIHLCIACLLSALIRPDGLIIAVPLILIYWKQARWNIDFLKKILIWSILPGVCYFLWRYLYFGKLFPLPFYVKSIQTNSLGPYAVDSVRMFLSYTILVLGPLLLYIFFSMYKKGDAKKRGILVSMLLFPLLIYPLFQLDQNIAARFQIPLFIGVGTSFILCYQKGRIANVFLGIFLILAGIRWVFYVGVYAKPRFHNNIYAIAQKLQALPPTNMATTEAGWLAYYPKWPVMDLWGLNTEGIGEQLVGKEALEAFMPELIVLHYGAVDYGLIWENWDKVEYEKEKSWENMVFNTYKFAKEKGGYHCMMVPNENKAAINTPLYQWMETQIGIINEVRQHQLPPNYVERYNMFLIDSNYQGYDTLSKLLEELGGISLEEYKELMN